MGCRIVRDPSHPAHEAPQPCPHRSPVSSLGNVAQFRLGAQQARIGILPWTAARSPTASRTLENCMNTPEPAPRSPSRPRPRDRPSARLPPNPHREAERPASGPAAGDCSAGPATQADAGGVAASGTSAPYKGAGGRSHWRAGAAGDAATAQADAAGEAADAAASPQAVASQAGYAALAVLLPRAPRTTPTRHLPIRSPRR